MAMDGDQLGVHYTVEPFGCHHVGLPLHEWKEVRFVSGSSPYLPCDSWRTPRDQGMGEGSLGNVCGVWLYVMVDG